MIHDLLDIVGSHHPVFIIGNKIDLLPKDSKGYLHHVQKSIAEYAKQVGNVTSCGYLRCPVIDTLDV